MSCVTIAGLTESTAARLLERQVRERCGPGLAGVQAVVELAIQPGTGAEGFRIEDSPGGVRITGNEERGLIYGVGRLLRTSRFEPGRFVPGSWRGESAPKMPVRGIYFATHFHNFYHDAPVERVQSYIEDLALWGTNAFSVWFDMHHFNGIRDPNARVMLDRLQAFLRTAKSVGMSCGLTLIGNEGYADSPVEMRAKGPGRGGFYEREICPNAPGGEEQILKQFRELFAEFADIGIDLVWVWPYDQGSCACDMCRPWGSNGFLKIAPAVANTAREAFAGCRVYLSAWYMDAEEWRGMAEALPTRPDWADYLIVEPHLLNEGSVPGELPVVGFPEISMRGMWPWGGFGANPMPGHIQGYWNEFGPKSVGGFPYSEGIFEDINKAIMAQLYWDPDRPTSDIVREYAAFEFSPDVAQDVMEVIETLESNHRLRLPPGLVLVPNWMSADDPGAEEAYKAAKRIDAKLEPPVRQSWRWRVLYLRALLDAELKANDGKPNEACWKAFDELTDMYFAQIADPTVKPPGRSD